MVVESGGEKITKWDFNYGGGGGGDEKGDGGGDEKVVVEIGAEMMEVEM